MSCLQFCRQSNCGILNHLSSDEVAQEAQDLYNRWPKLDHADKRKVIEAITAKIEVVRDDITVELCYFPTSKLVASSATSPAAELTTTSMPLQ